MTGEEWLLEMTGEEWSLDMTVIRDFLVSSTTLQTSGQITARSNDLRLQGLLKEPTGPLPDHNGKGVRMLPGTRFLHFQGPSQSIAPSAWSL